MVNSLRTTININYVYYVSLLIGLYGSITNFVFISPLPSLLSIILFLIIIIRLKVLHKEKVQIKKIVFYLYLFFMYCFISTLVYYPKSFLYFDFYRYDANFIISYSPLLIVSFFHYKINFNILLKRFLVFSTVLNLLALFFNLVYTKFAIFYEWSNPYYYYHALFKSTNAAGGFISIIISLNVIYYLKYRKLKWFILVLLNIFLLLLTTSRGSLLGLILGFIFFYFNFKNKKYYILAAISIICLLQGLILFVSFPFYDQYIRDVDIYKFINNTSFEDINVTAYLPDFLSISDTKSTNLLIRLIDTWPRGVDEFLHSPLFGAGFGSVNDFPLTFEGLDNIFALNSQASKKFDDAHAHHSYLHILGELGLLGLSIFLLFWIAIYKYLDSKPNTIFKDFLLVSYFNLTIMSFTEHRITSPSNALPFIICLCLFILNENFHKKGLIKAFDI